ncbi:MAG: alpha-L-fucosidase [Planctomycetota bacterium]
MFTRAICLMYLFLCIVLSSCSIREAQPDAGAQYTADWESLKKHNEAPDWFRDAKFGIYFHWGVYTVPAFGNEWYPRNMHIKKRPEYKHHIDTYGDPSKVGYHDFVPMFNAEMFNADKWAELFQQAGARFAGPVAEHHDGFAMWDSRLTPWNAKDTGPKRDVTGELAAAIRKRGMRFITTFHHARNRKWYPRVQGWPTTSDDPKLQMLYGNMPAEQFNQMWLAKLKEVIDKYRPALIWFDGRLEDVPESYHKDFLAYYFNGAKKWRKEVVVTYKGRDLPREVGVEDFEKGRQNRITEYTWLTDDTISHGSWCYTHELKIKSTRYVLHVLIDIVSKNGQLLLNISPKADGTIPRNQRKVLLGIGEWLQKYGEAIYGTRPFVVFGEGPTRLKTGGEFARTKLLYKPQDFRFTTKVNFVYAIQLGWPGGRHETLLKSFSGKHRQDSLKIKSVTMLGSDEKIAWSLREDGLAVTSPLSPPDNMAVVYKIETNGIKHFRSRANQVNQATPPALLTTETHSQTAMQLQAARQ